MVGRNQIRKLISMRQAAWVREINVFLSIFFNQNESHLIRGMEKPGADKQTHLPDGFTMDHPAFAIIRNLYGPSK